MDRHIAAKPLRKCDAARHISSSVSKLLQTDARLSPGNGVHIAFKVKDRKMVRRFHKAALAHGGTDAGAPGLRPEYDANYYGAFVCDPDGNKLEAVTLTST